MVFLSSPSDLSTEVESLKSSLFQFSKYTENTYNVRIIQKSGEDADKGPQRPQKLINELLDRCDLFVGLMGKNYGSPTGLTESGTEEEFNFVFNKNELKHRPQMKMFFKQINELMLNKNERKEYKKVKEFMNRIRTNFYFDTYKKIEEVIRIVQEKIEEYIIQLPEIKEFGISHKQVKSGEGITLSYNVKNAFLPLKLERFYKDGSDQSDYNLKYLKGERGDGLVNKDTLYRLTASNEFGKRSKECEVEVIQETNKTTVAKSQITSLLEETEKTLSKTSDVMKESECIRKAKILFNRINEHLIDIDNERKRNDGSTFIIEQIGPNKYIKDPNSIKILASHFTIIGVRSKE